MSDRVQGNGQRAPELPQPGTGRRRSMAILVGLLIVLPAAYVLSSVGGGDWRPVASASALEEDEVIYHEAFRLFVVRTDDGPIALSARTPHLGHRALYCPFADAFQEAHGAVFDRRGFALAGPVSRGLDRLPARVRDGVVEVDPSEVVAGPPRAGAT
ncbi:MAG: Rieske (2Fe-2S) protein, partial [Actinomycetota bacterium]